MFFIVVDNFWPVFCKLPEDKNYKNILLKVKLYMIDIAVVIELPNLADL